MKHLALAFYCISLMAQLGAVFIAISLVNRARDFRTGWFLLAIGLTLMLGRRISPIISTINTGQFNLIDALLSFPISLFLLLGVWGLKKVLINEIYLNKKLISMTKTDYLTSALSRMETFERTELEIARSARTKRPIALLSIDIDHFKHINDRFGHHIGDEVLKGMVRFFQAKIRAIDFIGRIGGEEFLVVLPEINQFAALEVAERLRKDLSHFHCYEHCGKTINITVSIGVVLIAPDDEKIKPLSTTPSGGPSEVLESYLELADEAMYYAKKHGRNRCHLSTKVPVDQTIVAAKANATQIMAAEANAGEQR